MGRVSATLSANAAVATFTRARISHARSVSCVAMQRTEIHGLHVLLRVAAIRRCEVHARYTALDSIRFPG